MELHAACSPFGAAREGDEDISVDARMIHYLSYPSGESVNDNSAEVDVQVFYDGAKVIASRILDVATRHPRLQRMMTGDLNGVFRNIPIHADHVGRFAGVICDLGILDIDFAYPFGWSKSPASYWVAGAAIKFIHARSRPSWPSRQPSSSDPFDSRSLWHVLHAYDRLLLSSSSWHLFSVLPIFLISVLSLRKQKTI